MNRTLPRVIAEFTSALLKAARLVMASDRGINAKTGTNTLIGSNLVKQIRVQNDLSDTDDIMASLIFNGYMDYVERGRKPGGKWVPEQPIIDWLKRKHIVSSNDNVRSVAYLVRRSIYEKGIKGRPLMDAIMDEGDRLFNDTYAEMMVEAAIAPVTEFFNRK